MEYLQVFDSDKKAINESVERGEKYNLPRGKFFMIGIVFIQNSDGKFLLQKTSTSRHSCIATTGGHVAYKDNGFQTVLRECKEELGLSLNPEDLHYVDTCMFANAYLETYYTKKDVDIKDLTIQEEEVESINWYSVPEIRELIEEKQFREGNIKPFEKVLEFKRNSSKIDINND